MITLEEQEAMISTGLRAIMREIENEGPPDHAVIILDLYGRYVRNMEARGFEPMHEDSYLKRWKAKRKAGKVEMMKWKNKWYVWEKEPAKKAGDLQK